MASSRRQSVSLPSIREVLPELFQPRPAGAPAHVPQSRMTLPSIAPLTISSPTHRSSPQYPSPSSPRALSPGGTRRRRDSLLYAPSPPSTGVLERSRSPTGRERRGSVRRAAPVPLSQHPGDWAVPSTSRAGAGPTIPLPTPPASASHQHTTSLSPEAQFAAARPLEMRFYDPRADASDGEPSDDEDDEPGSPAGSRPGTGAGGGAPARRRRPEERRHLCTQCDKRFSRPSSLRIHENTHTGNRPFACDFPGCFRTFSVNSNMRRHARTHAPDAPAGDGARGNQYPPGVRDGAMSPASDFSGE